MCITGCVVYPLKAYPDFQAHVPVISYGKE